LIDLSEKLSIKTAELDKSKRLIEMINIEFRKEIDYLNKALELK
jgi:hypothetical protein